MELLPGKKIYFLSDFHLGAPDFAASLLREKKIDIKYSIDDIKNDLSNMSQFTLNDSGE